MAVPSPSGPTAPVGLTADDLLERWPSVRPFLLVGVLSTTAGGLVAAVSRPTDFGRGPWLAAYLVLVTGVVQVALALGQAWLADRPDPGLLRGELATWNLGAAGVVAGTLLDAPALTTAGGAVTAAALVLFLLAVRGRHRSPAWVGLAYRGIVTFVLLSVPVGLVLAWIRQP